MSCDGLQRYHFSLRRVVPLCLKIRVDCMFLQKRGFRIVLLGQTQPCHVSGVSNSRQPFFIMISYNPNLNFINV